MPRRRLLAAGQIAVNDGRANGTPANRELDPRYRRETGQFTAADAAGRPGWPASRRLAALDVRACRQG